MIRDNPLKQRLAAGKKSLGLWQVTQSTLAAGVVARAGYDFVLIDHEHGAHDFMGTIDIINALKANGTDGGPAAIVRVPWNDPVTIKRVLDTGAEGIMVPMVEDASAARAAVEACFYPPRGTRGCAIGSVPATAYGADAIDYWNGINDNLVIVIQIETPKAVENIPEIAAVDGIDVLFVGPNDLTVNAGDAPHARTTETAELIVRAEDAIKASSRALASTNHYPDGHMAMFERDFDMVTGGSELALLRKLADEQITAHRAANG